jgi:hypothetical protein
LEFFFFEGGLVASEDSISQNSKMQKDTASTCLKNYPWTNRSSECARRLLEIRKDGSGQRLNTTTATCADLSVESIIHPLAIRRLQAIADVAMRSGQLIDSKRVHRVRWCEPPLSDLELYGCRMGSRDRDGGDVDEVVKSDTQILKSVFVSVDAKRRADTTQGIVMFGRLSKRSVAIKLTPIFSDEFTSPLEALVHLPDEASNEACACAYLNALSVDAASPFFVHTYLATSHVFEDPQTESPALPPRRRRATKNPNLLSILTSVDLSGEGEESDVGRLDTGLGKVLREKVRETRGKTKETQISLLNRIASAYTKLSNMEEDAVKKGSGASEEVLKKRSAHLRDILASQVVMDSSPVQGELRIVGVKCLVQQKLDGTVGKLYDRILQEKVSDADKIRIFHAVICQQILALGAAQHHLGFIHNDVHLENWGYVAVNPKNVLRFEDLRDESRRALYEIPTFGVVLKMFDFGRCSFFAPSTKALETTVPILSEYAAHRELRVTGFVHNFQTDVLRLIYEWFLFSRDIMKLLARSRAHDMHARALKDLCRHAAFWECKSAEDAKLRDELRAGVKLERDEWMNLVMTSQVRSGQVYNSFMEPSHILLPKSERGMGFLDPFIIRDELDEERHAFPVLFPSQTRPQPSKN